MPALCLNVKGHLGRISKELRAIRLYIATHGGVPAAHSADVDELATSIAETSAVVAAMARDAGERSVPRRAARVRVSLGSARPGK